MPWHIYLARRLTTILFALAAAPSALAAQIPSPESILGHQVGEDFYLANYDESIDYFQQLAAASDRIQLEKIGRTSAGADWYLAIISSPENLANLERIREIGQQLAHPGEMTESQARQLAAEGRAIVHIDGGLHATEVAHAQHTMQLAYDLATAQGDPELDAILDQVVLLLWPSINPDGQNITVEWYRSNLGTPFEVSPLPRLYQKYIGHDNNRDGYMLNVLESRVTTRVIRAWEPQILYNHHQTAPFPARIWIPPFAEPISEFVHPLMWRTVNLVGMAMAQALEERGQRGAVHMGTGFDNWYPGFMDHAHNFHNVAAFLTETGLYRYATPHFYTVSDFPKNRRDLRPQSLYSSPWEGGWWRLRDAVDYMLTASISVLDVAAKYKEDLLFNRYQAGRDVIEHYQKNPPFAFFVPQEQRDPVAAVELLRRLAFNGIEVHNLSADAVFEGQSYQAGTWVIRMDQPFANFVRQLFAVQEYPDLREYPEGPPDQPYDIAGWTLPYQMDVHVVAAQSPLDQEVLSKLQETAADASPWDSDTEDSSGFDSPIGVGFDSHRGAAGIRPPVGQLRGSGPALAVDGSENNAFRAINRAWGLGGRVSFAASNTNTRGGRYILTGLTESQQRALVSNLALTGTRSAAAGQRIERPRIGLYRPWRPSMDEGWTRWLLERYDFDFKNVYNADFKAGKLGQRFDVLLMPDLSPQSVREGWAKGTIPERYAGGLGKEGLRHLEEFVRAGGTLVTLNRSSLLAVEEFALPIENVAAQHDRKEFFTSGSILEMIVDPSHPVMTGMPERAKIFVSESPVFTILDGFQGSVLAHYPTTGSPLLSGYLIGEEHLQGYAAALDVRHGDGHVLLLGMRPQWRGQPFGTFRILFNALLYSTNKAIEAPGNPDFWTRPEPPTTDTEEPDGTPKESE